MYRNELPSKDRLDELFNYNQLTGDVTRAKDCGKTRAGDTVGSTASNGYLRVTIDYKSHALTGIIYKIMTGLEPVGDVDHIDGTRINNKWGNLRIVDRMGNMRNSKMFSTNTSGVVGVTYDNVNLKWVAQICVNYKNVKLGRYREKSSAISARKEAEVKYGFHENHGRVID